jgi:predicted DNA-binding protein with PD1-like motif
MRRIEHPGPVARERVRTVDGGLRKVEVLLDPGKSLLDALSAVLSRHQATSAVANLHGGSFNPFVYVMPALSPTPAHAVYYSDRHEPEGSVRLESATVTLGRRDDEPWLHCHGTWQDASGQRLGGHVLPDEARIEEPIHASIWLLDGLSFDVVASPETTFTLFEPIPRAIAKCASNSGFAMAVRPNEDFCTALLDACKVRGIAGARVRGGVGSLVGAKFDDGREVEPFVTEVFIREGCVDSDESGDLVAQIDVCVIDYLGGLNEGRLMRGSNPVLVTFELVVEPTRYKQSEASDV